MAADADILFTEHRQGVLRYLSRVIGQAEMARDLTQEVFLRVARADAPERRDEWRAWVFGIARNLALNHLRDRSRQPQAVELVDTNTPATQELSLALDRALASLDVVDRDTFLLREVGGLSYEEIAAASSLTVAAVRCRLHRTRQQLREQLAPTLVERCSNGVRLMPAREMTPASDIGNRTSAIGYRLSDRSIDHRLSSNGVTNMDPYEVIGAFVDGERVDPGALKAALSTDEGRQYLVDIAILREMSNGDGATGHREISGYRDIGVSGHRDAATMSRRWLAPGAAAAAVVVALAGGYAAGRQAAPASSLDRQALARSGANQPAPAPTSVIRLEPGVDWHEQTPRN